MADEPENLVLRLLREVRAKQDELSAKQDELSAKLREHDRRFQVIGEHMDDRFEQIDGRFDEMRDLMTHMLGVSTASELQLREHKAKLRDMDRWRQRTDERIEKLEAE